MYRVTRKQKIIKDGNVIEFEDFRDVENQGLAIVLRSCIVENEIALGGQSYGSNKVIFETPTFYRSVTVTIEEIS